MLSLAFIWLLLDWLGFINGKRFRILSWLLAIITVILLFSLNISDQQIIRGKLVNSWFIAMPLLAFVAALLLPNRPSHWSMPRWLGVFLSAVALCLPFILSPPDLWPGIDSKDSDMNKRSFYQWLEANFTEEEISQPNQLIAFYSPSCKFCRYTAYKVDGLIRQINLPVTVVFAGEFDDASPYFTQRGLTALPAKPSKPSELFDITNRRVPMVVQLSYGEITGIYRYAEFDDKRIKHSMQ
ncbi:MAG: hypothetical protein LAT54_01735 [Cryomorphaceae bacterium]|nr:hypothetical protein [Cryomorphaceae bacterium]